MSLRCPRCTQPLILRDLTLDKPVKGRVETMGHVALPAGSAINGQVQCGQFTSNGRFEGRAVVHGPAELFPNSVTTGELRAQSLTVQPGATLRGHARIGPTATPKPSPLQQPHAPAPSISPASASQPANLRLSREA